MARESEQSSQQKLQAAVSIGATLVGALFGRKAISVGTLGRATTAARGMSRTMKEAGDVAAGLGIGRGCTRTDAGSRRPDSRRKRRRSRPTSTGRRCWNR